MLEGFLCPLCMKDLGDVIQLQVHFDETHSKEDQTFLKSITDLFKNARKSNDEETVIKPTKQSKDSKLKQINLNVDPVSGISLNLYPPNKNETPRRSHFAEFKKIRSSRVDRYATETNRLIIRLDKMLDNIPSDPVRRRDHEQTIVQWVEEDLVKLCPTCARGFNLARRKHHCRLCGSVMCKECSRFVEWSFCRRLINPSTISQYKPPERLGHSPGSKLDTRSIGSTISRTGLSVFKLRKAGSRESVNSMMSVMDSKSAEEFRTCHYCQDLLVRREEQIDFATTKPIITQFYERLSDYVKEGTDLSPQYLKMADSLNNGETNYHLDDAKVLRVKLLKIAENVDSMSKKISTLGTEETAEDEIPKNQRRFLLQNQIRRASVNFIKETLVGLPSLPSQEELVKLQERRKEEIARKIEEERRKAQAARQKYQEMQEKRLADSKNNTPNTKFNQSNVSYETGVVFSANSQDQAFNSSVSEDPMVQQMNIIRGYIQQARSANRFDEVSMLESNLKELQIEYRRQKISESEQLKNVTPATPKVASVTPSAQRLQFDTPHRPRNSDKKSSSSQQQQHSTLVPSRVEQQQHHSTLVPKTNPVQNSTLVPRTNPVFDENKMKLANGSAKSTGDTSNPFGDDDDSDTDEYDASGKNPFAE